MDRACCLQLAESWLDLAQISDDRDCVADVLGQYVEVATVRFLGG